jgi:hypothetical protein
MQKSLRISFLSFSFPFFLSFFPFLSLFHPFLHPPPPHSSLLLARTCATMLAVQSPPAIPPQKLKTKKAITLSLSPSPQSPQSVSMMMMMIMTTKDDDRGCHTPLSACQEGCRGNISKSVFLFSSLCCSCSCCCCSLRRYYWVVVVVATHINFHHSRYPSIHPFVCPPI